MSKYAKIGKEGRILFPIDSRRKYNIKDGGDCGGNGISEEGRKFLT